MRKMTESVRVLAGLLAAAVVASGCAGSRPTATGPLPPLPAGVSDADAPVVPAGGIAAAQEPGAVQPAGYKPGVGHNLQQRKIERRGTGAPCDYIPRELDKVSLPEHRIEPPDVVQITAVRLVPKPPYRFEPLDTVIVQARSPLPREPLAGEYVVEPDGRVNLGGSYGSVTVAGLTPDDVKAAIEKQLADLLKDPFVYVAPGRTRPLQQVVGEHLVRPDGRVSLGTYGTVHVAGLTTTQAKLAVEEHLRQFLVNPEVAVDVAAYNSKIIYLIFDGGGTVQQMIRLPVTGNETVIDAISQAGGMTLPAASKYRVWVARPAPAGCKGVQILPVDWVGVTMDAKTETNYQLLPGDRVYVNAKPLSTLDNALARVFTPIQRTFGFIILGSSTVQQLSGQGFTTTTTTR